MRSLTQLHDLTRTLVIRELKVRYRRSAVGFLWTMLQPLLNMLVLTIVFSALFRFNLHNYPVYALAGILWWNFFSQTVTTSMNSLRNNAALLQKVPVPMPVFPIATALSGVVNLLFALVPLLLLIVVTGDHWSWSLLFLPVSIIIATIFTLGAGLLLSPLAVFFVDTVEMIAVVLTTLMYLTPVFYPIEIIPKKYLWLVRFNPIRSVLEVFRDPIYNHKIPPWTHLTVATSIALFSLLLGSWVFQKSAKRIPFYF